MRNSINFKRSTGLDLISLSRLRGRRPRYWIGAVFVLVLSYLAAPRVYDLVQLAEWRARLFQFLIEANWKPLVPHFVKVVLIEDDEYWTGSPSGRRPIKRDYLAQLVDKFVKTNVRVIALDFDLRLPDPLDFRVPLAYKDETDKLILSIINAAEKGKKVVLAKTIWRTDSTNCETKCRLEPDIYEPYGICTLLRRDGQWVNPGAPPKFAISDQAKKNLTCGYIALPNDRLMIAGQLELDDGSYIDSLALALARAVDPELVNDFVSSSSSEASYYSYISETKFAHYNASLSARELLNTVEPELESKFKQPAVLIGGHWSLFAYNRGPRVDTHTTPIGYSVGAYVHANFTEALLDNRTFAASPWWFSEISELFFGVIAMSLFAAIANLWMEIATVVVLSLVLVIIEWVALQQFGLFVDAFIPLLALWLHSIYERLS
jgi:CHASE2 domain-containing sensor protein